MTSPVALETSALKLTALCSETVRSRPALTENDSSEASLLNPPHPLNNRHSRAVKNATGQQFKAREIIKFNRKMPVVIIKCNSLSAEQGVLLSVLLNLTLTCCWLTKGNKVCWNIICNMASGTNHSVVANCNASRNPHIGAYPNPVTNSDRFSLT